MPTTSSWWPWIARYSVLLAHSTPVAMANSVKGRCKVKLDVSYPARS